MTKGINPRPQKKITLRKDGRPRKQKQPNYTDSTDNLLNAIERAKAQNLERLINGLGIPNIGKHTGHILEENFPDIYAIAKINYEEYKRLQETEKQLKKEINKIKRSHKLSEDQDDARLLNTINKQLLDVKNKLKENGDIKGIGEVSIKAISDFFAQPQTKTILERLEKAGVNMKSKLSNQVIDNRFMGAAFVLTGTLPTMSREEASQLIQEHGGRVTGSVSKKTTYLLLGEGAGDKLAKAQSLGVKIISEDDLKNMLQ